jgi:hypothetical protein
MRQTCEYGEIVAVLLVEWYHRETHLGGKVGALPMDRMCQIPDEVPRGKFPEEASLWAASSAGLIVPRREG